MNKTVLITGASRGIGKAIAITFAKHHYNVIITASKSFNELMETSELIKQEGVKCLPILTDMSDYNAVSHMFEEIFIAFDSIDCVINNAGVSRIGLFTDLTVDMWNQLINTNLNSVFNTCHQIVPHMVSRKKGCIINISSIWGVDGASCEVAYSTSKGAINTFTKALAKELGPSNIRVNAIACGAIKTSMNHWMSKDEESAFTDSISLCRFGNPEEVADLAYYLASEKSSYITSQVIRLDGGMA